MKIKMLKAFGAHAVGATPELSDAEAKSLIDGGYAEEVKADPAEEIKTAIQAAVKAGIDEGISAIVKTMKVTGDGKKTPLQIEVGKDLSLEDPKGGFKSFSHFASDVRKANQANGRASEVLAKWADTVSVIAKTTGLMEELDDPTGGYLVPPEYRNQIIDASLEDAIIMPRATKIPMASNRVSIPFIQDTTHASSTVFGGVVLYRTAEASQYTASNIKVGRIELSLHSLTGMVVVTNELLEDSPISLEPILVNKFGQALTFVQEKDFLRGTGQGQPLGILNAGATVSVAAENAQTATTLNFQNVVKMYARFRGTNGVWMINHDVLPQLCTMSLAVGSAAIPVYLPANGAADAPYGTLMGLPVFKTEHCSTLGTVGDIVLADWRQYYIGTKGGVKTASSMHLRFDYNEMVYRFQVRYDGQPATPAPLTPEQSSATLGYFLTVATRN
jgi:HK97 family phage major capsid protein